MPCPPSPCPALSPAPGRTARLYYTLLLTHLGVEQAVQHRVGGPGLLREKHPGRRRVLHRPAQTERQLAEPLLLLRAFGWRCEACPAGRGGGTKACQGAQGARVGPEKRVHSRLPTHRQGMSGGGGCQSTGSDAGRPRGAASASASPGSRGSAGESSSGLQVETWVRWAAKDCTLLSLGTFRQAGSTPAALFLHPTPSCVH